MRGTSRLFVLLCLLTACGRTPSPAGVPGGDPERGPELIQAYGCGTCHVIPGVPGALGQVGPPLGQYARRIFIAGVLPNQSDSLVRWIMLPQLYLPGGAMPNLGVTEPEARHIAAYLYTLH